VPGRHGATKNVV